MQQEPSEPPWPPFRFHDRPRRRHSHWRDQPAWQDRPDWQEPAAGGAWSDRRDRRDRIRQRFHGDGSPIRRDPEDRIGGGVAAGIGERFGFSPTTTRIACVVAALVSQGWVVPLYFIGWLLIPAKGDTVNIGAKARHDSRGVTLAIAVASLLAVFLLLAGVLNDGSIEVYGWPQVVSVACLTLIWRNAPESEQAAMRHLVAPLESLGGGGDARRGTKLRLAVSAALLITGFSWLFSLHGGLQLLAPLGGFVLVVAGIVVVLGPWWLRIARDLLIERQARARAEERADMAARVHDSVLQTLALIQRSAEDPQTVVQLARAQERELRSWLFEGRAPGDTEVTSFAEGVKEIQRDVEARHGVPVEVVTVGDCPLDEHLSALLAATREATVNAAKWSGAGVIAVFAEVEPDKVAVAVRDRGKGFDLYAVPEDRKGVAESIRGRMIRHGGKATVQSTLGEGTKVTLTMARRLDQAGQAPTDGRRR
jgi:signal transduction histidine kinase/phage shock protein PspC (stress-responsive transcriptional regulator)